MPRPKLLDLFCGAGGAAMGYYRAGFDVVGVDHRPQPHYPFPFVQADVFDFLGNGGLQRFAAIHASPPCQAYAVCTPLVRRADHPDLVAKTRSALQAAGKPFVIENVQGSPLCCPIMLCGTMFGLRCEAWHLRRHRYFETSLLMLVSKACQCRGKVTAHVAGHMGKTERFRKNGGTHAGLQNARVAMAIDWMTGEELAQAIPPAYTEWIGRQMLRQVEDNR